MLCMSRFWLSSAWQCPVSRGVHSPPMRDAITKAFAVSGAAVLRIMAN